MRLAATRLQMLKIALTEVEKNFVGLVVGNQGTELLRRRQHHADADGSAGRKLGRARHDRPRLPSVDDELALLAKAGRGRSVSMVFGGGCEMVLHADRVRAAAETYIGLVEVGVGIIPAGWRHERDAGARARFDSEGRGRCRSVSVCEACV